LRATVGLNQFLRHQREPTANNLLERARIDLPVDPGRTGDGGQPPIFEVELAAATLARADQSRQATVPPELQEPASLHRAEAALAAREPADQLDAAILILDGARLSFERACHALQAGRMRDATIRGHEALDQFDRLGLASYAARVHDLLATTHKTLDPKRREEHLALAMEARHKSLA